MFEKSFKYLKVIVLCKYSEMVKILFVKTVNLGPILVPQDGFKV